jgi:ABC-type antimicrobial peptide transport system permease subunit
VLKALGYSQVQVLLIVLLEHGLIALIACISGILGVEVLIIVVQLVQEEAGELLNVDALNGFLILLIGTGLTLITALVAAWRPAQVRPLVMFNDRT